MSHEPLYDCQCGDDANLPAKQLRVYCSTLYCMKCWTASGGRECDFDGLKKFKSAHEKRIAAMRDYLIEIQRMVRLHVSISDQLRETVNAAVDAAKQEGG